MKKQFLTLLSIALFSISFLASCGGGEDAPTLADRLQGTWILGSVSGTQASFITPSTGFRVTFSGSNVTVIINGTTLTGTFTVDSTTVTTTIQYNGGTITFTNVTLSGAGDINLVFGTDLKRTSAKPADGFTFNLVKQ